MSVFGAFPEPQPPPPPVEKRRRVSMVFLVLLLIFVLVSALIVVFPFVTGPAIEQMTSADWSGYSVASDLSFPQPKVTSVNGSWTVPAVNVSVGESYSAVWVGIGGQFDDTIIQVGTEQDSIKGQAVYSAWYELLPSDAVTIDSLTVSAGDKVTASVSLLDRAGNVWSVEITDVTRSQSVRKSLVYASSMLSAEWIVERPTLFNRLSALADFGKVTFTDCGATIGGKAGTISSFPVTEIMLISRANVRLVSVSSLASGGSSFAVSYVG